MLVRSEGLRLRLQLPGRMLLRLLPGWLPGRLLVHGGTGGFLLAPAGSCWLLLLLLLLLPGWQQVRAWRVTKRCRPRKWHGSVGLCRHQLLHHTIWSTMPAECGKHVFPI